jgi:hypothetical protein
MHSSSTNWDEIEFHMGGFKDVCVKRAVAAPFGPKDVPSTLVTTIVPAEMHSKPPPPRQ